MHKWFFIIAVSACLLLQLYTPFTVYESLSISLFVFYILYFLNSLGNKLVILDVMILTAIMICLLMPVTGYHYFNSTNKLARLWLFHMRVPSNEFYGFMFPAVIAMIAGLKLPVFFKKETYNVHVQYMINAKVYLAKMKWQGLILVVIGIVASLAQDYVPAGLSFITYLMRYLMFVGVFYCLYSNFPNKKIILIGVFSLLFMRSVSAGMFGELVFMGAMTVILVVLNKNYRFLTKLSLFVLAIFSILLIQAVKPAFRKQTWNRTITESKLTIFSNILVEKINDPLSVFDSEKGMFALYVRFNEGQIVSRVMNSVPSRYPYANGETILLSVSASIVPRFLWPDKPEAGGVFNFKRFLGITLSGYSIGLSPFGEAYGNFGKIGAIIYMFFFGLLFNFFFHWLLKISIQLPSLILWFPFMFFYTVQIETDLVTMLNSFTKAALFCYLFYKIFPRVTKLKI